MVIRSSRVPTQEVSRRSPSVVCNFVCHDDRTFGLWNLGRLVLALRNRLREMTDETVVNKDVKGRARGVGPRFVRTRNHQGRPSQSFLSYRYKFQTPNCGVQRDTVGASVRPEERRGQKSLLMAYGRPTLPLRTQMDRCP